MIAEKYFDHVLQETKVIAIHSVFRKNYIIDRKMMSLDWQQDWNILSMLEYIRTSSLELVSKEIKEKKSPGFCG